MSKNPNQRPLLEIACVLTDGIAAADARAALAVPGGTAGEVVRGGHSGVEEGRVARNDRA
jgi:hypothetical protein